MAPHTASPLPALWAWFPAKMFTVLFALGRLPGWIAQWREMIADPDTKIGRPRQVYVGATERNYQAIGSR